jgi:hypothetical protein
MLIAMLKRPTGTCSLSRNLLKALRQSFAYHKFKLKNALPAAGAWKFANFTHSRKSGKTSLFFPIVPWLRQLHVELS